MYSQIIGALERNDDHSLSQKSFCAEQELNPQDFHIEVEGIGKIDFPLDEATLQKLRQVSSDAKFGLREKTLLDKKVRDTQEISAEKLSIKYNDHTFSYLLKKMRDGLGLSENAELTAHLHNMLIYGPGQFFKHHQDSEKLEGMIATLVIVLPSAHIGGDLIVNHNNKKHRFVTENVDSKKFKCLAFYADCHHEVEKIKQGNRVALTYNLVLKSPEIQTHKHGNKQLEAAIKEYFPEDKESEDHPMPLIYFLDHSYTEHSLRWNVLKSVDRQNALDFRSAAKTLGLIPHLALVELHESWTADGDEDDPEPDELIDNSTTLSYWLDENDNKLPYGEYSISDDEACWTKDTEEFKPSDTEYEGYMGNYGNTVDYWYRRAAVVLWPESDQIAMNFKLNYDSALENLLKLTAQPGHEKKVLDILRKAKDFLHKNSTPNVFRSFANIALYIQEQDVAKSILAEFSLSIFNTNAIEEFVKLQKFYGISWCLELINHWTLDEGFRMPSRNVIEKDFDQVVLQLQALHADAKLTSYLLNHQINQTVASDKQFLNRSPVEISKSLDNRINILKHLLNACDLHREAAITQKLIQYITSSPQLYPEHELANMIVEIKVFPHGTYVSGYVLLKDHVLNGIRKELDKGLRDPGDLSIDATMTCNCDLCKTSGLFLKSKTDKNKVWPIVAYDREHVMNVFSRLGVPVHLSVEKKGSPHKLVMLKSDKLYQMAKDRFDKLTENYEKLIGSSRSKCANLQR